MRQLGAALVLATLLAACGSHVPGRAAAAGAAGAKALALRGGFVNEAFGDRTYKLYVPKALPAGNVPLVVMLHGCTQDPDQFAAGTRMNALADKEGALVLYPDQPRLAHPFKCWKWFDPASQQRAGKGEAGIIAGMVEQVAKARPVDRGAIYAAGISAGGAMTAILGATYPDVFSAISVASGIEYAAASSEMEGRTVMSKGGPDPATTGRRAYEAMGQHARVMPTIVFHGADDRIVAPLNADQVVGQWAQTNDLAANGKDDDDVDAVPDGKEEAQAPNGRRYTRWFFKDAQGKTVIEKVAVSGMGHAWSGGDSAGSYTDPLGPDATRMTWDFFRANRRKAAKV